MITMITSLLQFAYIYGPSILIGILAIRWYITLQTKSAHILKFKIPHIFVIPIIIAIASYQQITTTSLALVLISLGLLIGIILAYSDNSVQFIKNVKTIEIQESYYFAIILIIVVLLNSLYFFTTIKPLPILLGYAIGISTTYTVRYFIRIYKGS